jgi:pimeloyl-ACP methyl ester carboxylesterase
MKVHANGLDIEVEVSGEASNPAVLLTMGLGMQLVSWPDALVNDLVQAGYRVIRYDNRDIGLSSYFDHVGAPNMVWQIFKSKIGLGVKSAYGLQDMARDGLGVLDALGISQAHIVGVSMGGMISQRIAFTAPKRVLSLTSIMSSSGAPRLPEATPSVLTAMLNRPTSRRTADIVAHSMKLFALIGSPAYPPAEKELRERLTMAVERAYHPVGMLRQLLAVAADTKRYEHLAQIKSPTLVIHGKADPLVPIECGQDTASRIPNAHFVAVEGMGHDLPPGVTKILIDLMIPHLRQHTTA